MKDKIGRIYGEVRPFLIGTIALFAVLLMLGLLPLPIEIEIFIPFILLALAIILLLLTFIEPGRRADGQTSDKYKEYKYKE